VKTGAHAGGAEHRDLLREARSSLREAVGAVPADLRGTRPGPDRWSVAEVLDHLVRVERTVAGLVRSMAAEVRAAAVSGDPPGDEASGDDIAVRGLRPVLDRGRRVRSADAFQPDGVVGWAEAWAALEGSRATLLAEVEAAAGLPLERANRPHFAIGPLNGREWIVFVARHEERHAAQVREIARSLAGPPVAIIFDLDNCLARADEIPGLLEPGFEAVRRANGGTVAGAELERALDACRYRPFDEVAREHGFSEAMVRAGHRVFGTTTVDAPMTGYPDLPILADIPVRRFLVTTGFRRLQRSKIDALGIAPLFEAIRIDAIDEGRPAGKEAVFRDILRDHGLRPDQVLVVGDSSSSEIAAGNRLGMTTVQILRPGVERSPAASRHVAGLAELREVVGPA
jgi:FMN phosphatase YigB (HAD superfamily)